MRSKTSQQVTEFLAIAARDGFVVSVSPAGAVSITAQFKSGDRAAFARLDMTAPGVLEAAPLRGGSVFGTDGGSVGGAVALTSGTFRMTKTGEARRFVAELRRCK